MALFFKYDCTYENCKKVYANLTDLIVHIELEHLDFDPVKLQKLEDEKPECVPFSYIQRFSQPDAPIPRPINEPLPKPPEPLPSEPPYYQPVYHPSIQPPPVKQSKQVEYSKPSEDYPPFDAFPMKDPKTFYTLDNSHKKPYACNMVGCQKRYKNINGMKYHYKNFHKYVGTAFSTVGAPYAKKAPKKPPAATVTSTTMLLPPFQQFYARAPPPGDYGPEMGYHYPPAAMNDYAAYLNGVDEFEHARMAYQPPPAYCDYSYMQMGAYVPNGYELPPNYNNNTIVNNVPIPQLAGYNYGRYEGGNDYDYSAACRYTQAASYDEYK